MDVLLVEPSYKNKYPPMGLMKISSYHKSRGDFVQFHKGLLESNRMWDRIYITTLFTFDYKVTLKTIEYYKNLVTSPNNIYIGGISATLMKAKFKKDTGLKNIFEGIIENSKLIGFNDNENIDLYPLDYSILYDVDYEYKAGDNFLGYTTRGCINKCNFCAVPILESEFKYTNNIVNQIETARKEYGDKRNLLLLDNNILGLSIDRLKDLVNDLKSVGFEKGPTFIRPLKFDLQMLKIKHLEMQGKNTTSHILELWNDFKGLQNKKISKKNRKIVTEIISNISFEYDDLFEGMLHHEDTIRELFLKYEHRRPLQRYIDFNQGLDAREIVSNPDKLKILCKLPLKPFRVAFDHISLKDTYIEAIKAANKNGINHFSNYLLYNYQDSPIDLYQRLKININLAKELNCDIYSFPMKYAPINETDRAFVGKNWNKHYLSSIRAILNVTKGVVARGEKFFLKAFGKDEEEYIKILSMPKDFIVYRSHFQSNGLTKKWSDLYDQISKEEVLEVLRNYKKIDTCNCEFNDKQMKMLEFYKITYK